MHPYQPPLKPFTPIPGMDCVQKGNPENGYSMTCKPPSQNLLGWLGLFPLSNAIKHFREYSEEQDPRRAKVQLLAGCGQLTLAVFALGASYYL